MIAEEIQIQVRWFSKMDLPQKFPIWNRMISTNRFNAKFPRQNRIISRMGLTPKQISKCEWNDFKRIYYTKFQIPEQGNFLAIMWMTIIRRWINLNILDNFSIYVRLIQRTQNQYCKNENWKFELTPLDEQ